MTSIVEYLRDKYGPWGWMGQRAHDAEGINRVLPLDFIISCNYGREIPFFFREEDVFSIEKLSGVRKNWSNEDLASSLSGALGGDILKRWKSYGKPASLLCYRSVRQLENTANVSVYKPALFAVPERLKRHFDSKILLHRNIDKLSMPRIYSVIDSPGRRTFNSLRKELGMPFVVQFPYGSSGSSTHIIRAEAEYNRIRRKDPLSAAVLRRYINGFSLNVNAVVVSGRGGVRVLCSYPSVQITGLAECGNSRSAYCGNDYASSACLEKKAISEVRRQAEIAGKWMSLAGYRGVFGMDFVVKDDSVYPVEINPRFQNSTSLHTTLGAKSGAGRKAMFLLHIAEFLQMKDQKLRAFAEKFKEEDLMCPISGAQIILHNRMKKGVVTGSLAPGIYRMKEGRLVHVAESASIADCSSPDDILITSGVPRPYTEVEPDACLCKVQFLNGALRRSDLKRFTPETKKIISGVYKKLAIKDPSAAVAASVGGVPLTHDIRHGGK
jgi:predicted ATP-grasp superfamily ATP-dependent carboligase